MTESNTNNGNEMGPGASLRSANIRALNRDGSFNVKKINIPFFERFSIFHVLISASWGNFLLIIISFYIITNLFFAGAYYMIGIEHLTGISGVTESEKFSEAFFFSAQTITTLGYGRVAPAGFMANVISSLESMLGLLIFALVTGVLYGRFSRPAAKIRYSRTALIGPFQDINGFMFRIMNLHGSQLFELEANVTVTIQDPVTGIRDFHTLELERRKILFFGTTWTVVHPINESSPLYRLTNADFVEKDLEFIINLKGFDQTSSQPLYSHTSYKASEIDWGKKFVYMVHHRNGSLVVDAGRLHDTEPAGLN